MEGTLFRGTTVEIKDPNTQKVEIYLLAESFEDDYVFQIIRIDGFFKGALCGYVKKEAAVEAMNIRGVSIDHLKRELRRNIEDFDVKELKVISSL